MRIVLGVGGGIAAYKVASLLRRFTESGYDVTVVPTAAALQFVGEPTWAALSGKPVSTDVWTDVHEVPHVRIGQQADLVVVAPATADLLAKAAHGLADDLLTSTLLTARCPVVMAPAMHTEMWQHPATAANVATLRSRGVHVMDTASGRLTGADTGPGRLPEPEDIAAYCQQVLSAPADDALTGVHVVVTAGGTREPLDPVRYLGNRSSGKQGYAIADAAARRGAKVTLISTSTLPTPAGVDLVTVETALQLQEQVTAVQADVVVMAAAVADFRPAEAAGTKIKKTHDPADPDAAPTVRLVRNPDILAELVRQRGDCARPVLVGFAAETGDEHGDLLSYARAKLERKGCDLLVANQVGDGLTFGQDHTTVHLLRRGSPEVTTVGPATKAEVAAALWDAVIPLLHTS
ncbi:bifunctional phosphopantothenoylcysteine decarboxylase/phosphopantothenate--cysteine ligase CoaBC [Luteipulveratus sp. YIM 133132]|uniref:bifunctional phosphopantothenoylcysteine decarboxylase/phosphopantothenate--cysteine ligase CoaBC n=1 Tax=Luteipulveratus flavus TaxID=3031728 RepID=UPI0023AE9B04|nr:bifunctional phosphopantothenoylcysteine decarboxylase/phosphopantothenate--cysteine ligase CoaBC [Luteipulveratus sp. YIM 133132]MDE9366046.1 bifunctional phosphopantothenoylcysteine decarboxylase/phosphopantothenate--cysteine ligase CoaBC [Luteipulveratus sp. YIM 133132]